MDRLKHKFLDKDLTGIKTAEGYITLGGLFVPFFIEQILMNLMGTVNTLVLGRFSDEAVAACGAAGQVLGFLYVFYAVISGGASVVISHRLGEGNEKAAADAAYTSFLFSGIFSIVVSIVLSLFSRPLMVAMNLEGEVLEMAISYFNIVVRFSFVQSLISAISAILRSYGFSKPAVLASVLMNALNALFNYIVILRPFETPFYGASGVAIGNVAARIISFVVIFIVIQNTKAKISFGNRHLKDLSSIGGILKIGIPGGVANLSYSLAQIVTTAILALVGTQALSAKIYISSIVFYVYVTGYSMGMSASILMGWMTGAKEYDKAYRLNQILLKLTILLNLTLSIVFFVGYRPILSLFTTNPEIIEMARSIFFIDIFVEFGRAFNHIEDYSLRGAGDVVYPMVINILSCWFMSILFSYILGVRLEMGLKGVWIAFMLDECFRGLILFIRFKTKKWMKMKV